MNFKMSDFETWKVVMKVAVRYKVDPDEGEVRNQEFYDDLLDLYDGEENLEALEKWLDAEIPKHFPVVEERPVWVQGAQWAFQDGEPMLFVGQVEVTNIEYFHDTTVFYIFRPKGMWSTHQLKVVVQQY